MHIVAAPGSGKTTLGLEIFRRLRRPALVLSPTRVIRNQWIGRLRDFCPENDVFPPAWASRSLDEPGFLTSITYQALHTKYRDEIREADTDDDVAAQEETEIRTRAINSTGLVDGEAVTVTRDYDNTLPALNLVFDFTDDFLVRLGVAEVMARPPLGLLTPGGSLDSFNGPPYPYNAGNPGLDPYEATNIDLSAEWYFADEALISLAYFDKDVDSFFQTTESTIVPYSQSGLPTNLPPASSPLAVALGAGGDPDVEITQRVNGGSASVDGWEIVYQQPFGTFSDVLEGFGFTGNFTHVNSDKIIGFSEDAYNATLWYENERFSGRVSLAYRDPYQTRSPNDSGRDERGFNDTTHVDMAFSYILNDSIELTFEGINLTDEEENQVFDAADLVNVYHSFGREYIFGVRWTPEGF